MATADPAIPIAAPGRHWLLLVLGAYNAGIGLFAYIAPQAFFGIWVDHTGPFNIHLMRDVGAAYQMAGISLLWAGFSPRWRAPLTAAAGIFLTLHALIHVLEALSGALDAWHVTSEVASVVAPAALVWWLAISFLRASSREESAEGAEASKR